MKHIILSAAALLTLGGCVSQEQADARMARGCEAGVRSLLTDGAEIEQVTGRTFAADNSIDGQNRRATLATVTNEGWHTAEKQYSCLFHEQWGLFRSSHIPTLVHIDMGGNRIVGTKGGEMKGGLEQFTVLTGVVDRAMGQ